MRSAALVLLAIIMVVSSMTGCTGISKMAREATEQSTTEFIEWNKTMKAKIDALPVDQIKPFFVYFVEIVGEDKTRLPLESYKIMDDIGALLKSKDSKDFTDEDKAMLVGKWDRFWIVLFESAGSSIIKYLAERIRL